ncbi:MAG: flagellar hook-basal body complex protein [Lachnospiraceae bacterium]|nr:flagellar hook-basal body complex protein [Lachnospiraceae bacterium]
MLRAMDSAVAGLRAHQNKLDVIGHNLANVNTAGYKSQSYLFKEAMYQTSTNSTSGSGSSGGSGGVNAAQYGYGTMMGSIWVDMAASTPTQMGGLTATIDGEGFFMTMSTVSNGIAATGATASDAIKGADFQYTRVGQFKIDSDGFLVDSNSNNYIYGFQPQLNANATPPVTCLNATEFDKNQLRPIRVCMEDGTINLTADGDTIALAKSVKIDSEGKIIVGIEKEEQILDANGQPAVDANGNPIMRTVIKEATIGQVAVATFQNQEGLTKAGGSYYTSSRGDNSGICQASAPGAGGAAALITGYVEASNVDMAKEFSELITTQRGFQANTKMITVSDQILEELVNMKR